MFTDNDFHNIGLADNDIAQLSGQEPGRFNTVAIGLKESRLIGAYKTPGLRALPRTAPYMHNGQFKTLDEVVEYFDHGIDAGRHRYLASQLRESPGVARQLNLGPNDARALVLFLRSLEGAAVDPMVAAPK